MSRLDYRQQKIQEKRKQTPWRGFLMDLVSWYPLMLYKQQFEISRYPDTSRKPQLVATKTYMDTDNIGNFVGDNSFFQNFSHLYHATKLPVRSYFGVCENADYAEYVENVKNCYLSFVVCTGSENVVYSVSVFGTSKNIFDSVFITNQSENIYSSFAVESSMNVFYSRFVYNCSNIYFSSNLLGCHDCILCDGLENQRYCIQNQQYSQQEYATKKALLLQEKNAYVKHKDSMNKKGFVIASENSSGYGVVACNNVTNGIGVSKVSNGNNCIFVAGITGDSNNYDCIDAGIDMHDSYGLVLGGLHSQHYYNATCIEHCSNIYYSIQLENCSFCLGCIGLKNKSYCILNKQYSKEERYEKVDEIFTQMEQEGTLGHFFPASMNPFYFNDTAAYLIDPSFTKEEVTAKGYLWRDEAIKVDIPSDATIVSTKDVGNYEGYDEQGNRTINADILKCVIQDELGNYYRIIPMEYKFLMKHGLPLPRKHRLERMKENFKIS